MIYEEGGFLLSLIITYLFYLILKSATYRV